MKEFIGIDLGGTKINVVKINENLEVVKKVKIQRYNSNSLENIINAIESVVESLNSDQVYGIGFGVAGFVDFKEGIIHKSVNIPALYEVNIRKIFEEKFKKPVFVDNDAKAGAVAELYVGPYKGTKDFVFITFGTGIGSAIISDGKIVRGFDNLAGEIGHITLDPNGPLCACGKSGCFETFASGPSIRRIYIENISKYPKSPLLESVGFDESKIDTPLIFKFIESDENAKATLKFVAYKIGLGLSIVVNILNPERIIIGGGLGMSLKMIFDDIMESFNKNTLKIPRESVKFSFSNLQNDGVAIGSSLLPYIRYKEEK